MERDVAAADEVVRAVRSADPDVVITVGAESSVVGDGAVLRLPDRLTDAVEVLRQALYSG